MITVVYAYINGVLAGHLIFFIWTFRYVYLMRRKPVPVSELSPTKRQLLRGIFAGVYPKYKQGTLDYHLSLDVLNAKCIVCKDGTLVFGDEVRVYGKLQGYTFSKITLLSTTDKRFVRLYLQRKFTIAHIAGFILSTAWEVIHL